MWSQKWLAMIILTSYLKEEATMCQQELKLQRKDLFPCQVSLLVRNGSIIWDTHVTIGSMDGKVSQRRIKDHERFCSSSSRQDFFLQIKFKTFYDVCVMITREKNSKAIDVTFKIQFSQDGKQWRYYKEIDQIKVFHGVRNNSDFVVNEIHLTTKFIRFLPVKWKIGNCLQVAFYGQVATCDRSQLRMDRWCNTTFGSNITSRPTCSGELKARFDRALLLPRRQWRCYYSSALKPDLSAYDVTSKSLCYHTKHQELMTLQKRCTNKNKSRTPPRCHLVSESTGATDLNISDAVSSLNKFMNRMDRTASLSSRDLLYAINILEKTPYDELLKNVTPQNRALYAQSFIQLSSNLINESNIETWTNHLTNISTPSRLLKVIEDFGATFVNYLDCNNNSESEMTFQSENIRFTALPCTNRTTFSTRPSAFQDCDGRHNSSSGCYQWEDVVDTISVPATPFAGHNQYRVAFVIYKNAHKLFLHESMEEKSYLRSVQVNSHILSLTVKPERLLSKSRAVVLSLRPLPLQSHGNADLLCGFWNYSVPGTTYGAWSTEGCTAVSKSPNKVTCQCVHLTNFALLLQVTPNNENEDVHQDVLMWLTYLGCSLSLAAEILCLLAYKFLADAKETKIQIHMNLVACLALGHLVFLAGVESAVGQKVLCRVVAFSLHFLFLGSFSWMLVEGIYLLSKVKNVFEPYNGLKTAYMFAYGLPLVVVGITFSVRFDEYGAQQHCWLSVKSGTIWSFIGPVCVVILVNFVVLGFVVKKLMSTRSFRRKSDLQKIRDATRALILMLPLLGLTWLFGLMAVNQRTVLFQYLFVLFNSFQGVFLFLFLCVVNDEVKGGVRSFFRKRRVTQQVTKQVIKCRSKENCRRVQKHIVSTNNAFSKAHTVFDHDAEAVNYVRKSNQIMTASRSQQANKKTSADSTTHGWERETRNVTSIKLAWKEKMTIR